MLGLSRSEAGARQLLAAGAEVYRGDLDDPATLRGGAEEADAVIHCAFDRDFCKQGLITPLIEMARAKGRVAYVGEGRSRFAAAHVSDVARLYRLAVERAEPGARYHAVGEEGVAMRDIAEVLGRSLSLPVVSLSGDEVAEYFGWMAMFADHDMPAASAITREKLGWTPVGPGLLADLAQLEL